MDGTRNEREHREINERLNLCETSNGRESGGQQRRDTEAHQRKADDRDGRGIPVGWRNVWIILAGLHGKEQSE
jgi:hypothetical protein